MRIHNDSLRNSGENTVLLFNNNMSKVLKILQSLYSPRDRKSQRSMKWCDLMPLFFRIEPLDRCPPLRDKAAVVVILIVHARLVVTTLSSALSLIALAHDLSEQLLRLPVAGIILAKGA